MKLNNAGFPAMNRRAILSALAALGLVAGTAMPAAAQSAEEYYKGRELTLIVASSAGGSFDFFGRLISRHMPKYLPGNPTIVVQNMVGAGGTTGANYLYEVAPKDGSVFAVLQRNIFTYQLTKVEGVAYDISKFGFIGNPVPEHQVLMANDGAGITTLDDLKAKELTIASTTTGTDADILLKIMDQAVGAKVKPIAGYPGLNEMTLAYERGEVGGMFPSWGGFKSTRPDLVAATHPLLQIGDGKAPDLPDTPHLLELVSSDADKQMISLMQTPLLYAYPVVAPPDVPADRLAFLQAAFDKTMADADLIKEALASGYVIKPATGAQMAGTVTELFDLPAEVIDRAISMRSGG